MRETWTPLTTGYGYKADSFWNHECKLLKWKPSIYMPKAAARIWLEITNVRVERLQDITEKDAKAEGIKLSGSALRCALGNGPHFRDWFTLVWDELNAKRGFGWDVNPWVWVIEFRRVERE